MSSTFQKYGGFSAVSRVVMTFYENVLENDDVGHHFDDIDMPRLIDHQTKFVSSLMGGPGEMNDDRLAHVHGRISISDQEFDIVLGILREALREHSVEEADISEIATAFESKRHLIVSAGA